MVLPSAHCYGWRWGWPGGRCSGPYLTEQLGRRHHHCCCCGEVPVLEVAQRVRWVHLLHLRGVGGRQLPCPLS